MISCLAEARSLKLLALIFVKTSAFLSCGFIPDISTPFKPDLSISQPVEI